MRSTFRVNKQDIRYSLPVLLSGFASPNKMALVVGLLVSLLSSQSEDTFAPFLCTTVQLDYIEKRRDPRHTPRSDGAHLIKFNTVE